MPQCKHWIQKPNQVGNYYMNLNAIIKNQAVALKAFLSEKNINLPQTTCLHAIAVINGYKNWNTLNAILSGKIELPEAQDIEGIEDRLSNLEGTVNILWEDFYPLKDKFEDTDSYIDERLRGIDPDPS